jgi:hypothetical protein
MPTPLSTQAPSRTSGSARPSGGARDTGDLLPPRLALAFAPLHKRALGIAVGTATGLVLLAVTLLAMLRPRAEVAWLELLDEYFYGYEISFPGALIALVWGFGVGFVAGWFTAFCRNLALAISVFISRTRGELEETRDFLDHI